MPQVDLDQLITDARNCNFLEFKRLVEDVISLLVKAREKERVGELRIDKGLVYLPLRGEAVVIGDLHGDLESLETILRKSSFLGTFREYLPYLIFLGDYVDRGEESVELLYLVLRLKTLFNKRVILLRGNHEGPSDIRVNPHDLPFYMKAKFGNDWREVYLKVYQLFDSLSHSVVLPGKYLMLHGGLPEDIDSLKDIAIARETHPFKRDLEKVLWSDPEEIQGVRFSPRGAGRLFGKDVSEKILKRLGVEVLIRSHQSCEGVRVNHQGQVLTIFSRKGPPYHNSKASYLKINLADKVSDAYQLAGMAHLF